MTVELGIVPHEAEHLLVIGSTVRKPPTIVAAWLQSLAWQVIPKQVKPVYVFVDDANPPETRALLEAFVKEHGGFVAPGEPQPPQPDFADEGVTHLWQQSSMERVGRHKDGILNFARQNRAEAVWFTDADLIMDPMTLTSLWSVPEQIVCAVYWTRWNKVPEGMPPQHAGPQVWQGHPYNLNGNGMEEWELRKRLLDREVVHVFGQGACTLIRRDALMKGVSFAPVPGNTGPGLMQGEDRHFCIRAELMHLKMVADAWPDIFHIYHRPEDEQKIPEMLKRLEFHRRESGRDFDTDTVFFNESSFPPHVGDLVSLELHAMEPVRTNTGWQNAPTQHVRGRLGGLIGGKTLHPELEAALLTMQRGESRIVPVHFSDAYPFPPYRGQRRLIRLTLIDHKPHGFPPVIEDELLTNPRGSFLDMTTCSPELIDQIQEASVDG